jgi:hypothetical protein
MSSGSFSKKFEKAPHDTILALIAKLKTLGKETSRLRYLRNRGFEVPAVDFSGIGIKKNRGNE